MNDALDLPSQLLPLQTFKERLRELGLSPLHELEGGSDSAWLDSPSLVLTVRHSGYGSGFGGDRPVRVLEYVVDRPRAPPGSLVATDIANRIRAIHRVLTAPAPAVHAYHPEALRLQVLRFWQESGCTTYRIVTAPDSVAHVLRSGPSIVERLEAYARAATAIGAELIVRRTKADGAIVFRGTGEALHARAAAVATSTPRLHVWAAAGALVVSVEEGLRVRDELALPLANRISKARQQERLTWLEVDASAGASAVLAPSMSVADVRAALERLIASTEAELYSVEVDGVGKDVKRSKLAGLSTSLRAQLQAGQSVRVATSAKATVVKNARLEF